MENIELQNAIAEYIAEHERIIINHINFLKKRNPPKWFIAQDIKSNFGGWKFDKNLANLVDKYIKMYS